MFPLKEQNTAFLIMLVGELLSHALTLVPGWVTYSILVNTKPCCFTCERNMFGATTRAFGVPYAYSGVWRKSYFCHNRLVSLVTKCCLKNKVVLILWSCQLQYQASLKNPETVCGCYAAKEF